MKLRCKDCPGKLIDAHPCPVTVEAGGRRIKFCDRYCLMDYREQAKKPPRMILWLYEKRV